VTDTLTRLRRAFLAAWRHPRIGPLLRVVVAYVVVVEVGVQFLFGRLDIPGIDVSWLEPGRKSAPIPRGLFVNGAVVGSLYALVAIGLILVYRANRIINFSQAALGSVPAVLALVLMSRRGLPYGVAIPIALIGGALLGALVEIAFIRRFRRAPRLILTVATIGVAQVLAFVEFYIPKWVSGEALPPTDFPTPFGRFDFNVGIVRFTGDHVLTVLVVLAIVVALGAFFRYTDMGIAVRASAENGERAALLGIPVRRVSTVVWIIAAVVSATGIFLRAPLVGLPLGGLIGPSVVLFGLAAAVVGRMEHMPTAFIAGMGLGIIDQAAVYSTNRPTLARATILVVILLALLLQRASFSRAYELGASTWQTVREFRPIPTELRNVREIVAMRVVGGLGVVGLVLTAPYLVGDDNVGLTTQMLLFAMVGVSLVILTGWAGQISLGQFAFAGVGAAVAGGLAANHHWDFFVTLAVAGLAGAAVSVVIGLPALRIQGLFLAVTTLAFAFTVENFVLNREFFGWLMPKEGLEHFVERPVLYDRFDTAPDKRFYYLCLVFLVLALGAAASLRRNRSGRILIGARDNAAMVQAFGVSPARTRLAAFAISGFIAAVAGALLAYQQGTVTPGTFSPLASVEVFAMTVIGGLTSLPGAMLGAVYVKGVPHLLSDYMDNAALLSTGAGLLALLLFLPGGLSEAYYRVRDGLLRRVAARHQLYVPSLVADTRVVVEITRPDDAEIDALPVLEETRT
jgi:branched-chain amino acid transport system permease protein